MAAFIRQLAALWKFGTVDPLREDLGSGFYCTYIERPNGYGGYAYADIRLHREGNPLFVRQIVRHSGSFAAFPGFRRGPWEAKLTECRFEKKVSFPVDIHPYQNGRALFVWTLQPDGWYFADEDGFGAEKCEEVSLYSFIDERGRFTQPFDCMDD